MVSVRQVVVIMVCKPLIVSPRKSSADYLTWKLIVAANESLHILVCLRVKRLTLRIVQ